MNASTRFMKKVLVTEDCWIWTASKCHTGLGYGEFRFEGKLLKAHRYSYMNFIGKIPDGLCVLHRCDTPACVNPGHLFLGTNQDNVDDCFAKGRARKAVGEAHGNYKFSDEIIAEIMADTRSHKVIANDYGISLSYTYAVKSGLKRDIKKRVEK